MNKLILAFVLLIIGSVLITAVATQGNTVTEKTDVTKELISIATARYTTGNNINTTHPYNDFRVVNYPTTWKTEDCKVDLLAYGNSSTNFTLTTDYTFDGATGYIALVNSTALVGSISNNTYATYEYCADDYMNLSWGRTSVDVTMGLFAIAILIFSVGIFYSVAKESGIISR